MGYFKKKTPEELGIESEGILRFLDSVKRKGIELHSFMLLRHGEVCAEGWWKPYNRDQIHHLYSFSKSLTATAIGFAEQEGLLRLDERIVDLFPEDVPEVISENLSQVTIEHLLTMSCGQETEVESHSVDWKKDFFNHPFLHKPGTFYKYNTVGTNMLSAVIKKKNGEDLLTYLKPRLLDPLGIEDLFCYQLPDGTYHGGGGMKMTTESMAKFTQFMLQKGIWEGKALLPGWFERAGSKQIETAGDSEGHIKDWAHGYGYQCWMCCLPQSYRADGAFGQFGFVFPTLDAVVILTSATEQTQSLIDSMNEELLPAIHEKDQEEISVTPYLLATQKILAQKLDNLTLAPMEGDANPVMESRIAGKIYEAQGPCSSMERIIGGAGIFEVTEANLESMYFTFEENQVTWHVTEDGIKKAIHAATNQRFLTTVTDGFTYSATARWRSFEVLEMEIRRMDGLSGSRILFRFEGESLRIDSDETLIVQGDFGRFHKEIPAFRVNHEKAIIYLAGGCFWGTQHYFDLLTGVLHTEVGYANGGTENPSYEQVKYEHTGHAETVEILYNPKVIPLKEMLEIYYQAIEPTSLNKQGEDEGIQYRTGIYYLNPAEREIIAESLKELQKKYEEPIVVENLPMEN